MLRCMSRCPVKGHSVVHHLLDDPRDITRYTTALSVPKLQAIREGVLSNQLHPYLQSDQLNIPSSGTSYKQAKSPFTYQALLF